MASQRSPETPRTDDVFEAARDRFLKSLTPQARLLYSPCASAEDFRDAVKKLETTTLRVARRGKAFRCVYSLSKSLGPYFEVVNIFIQSNPQYSALFWGAFRLVLLLSSNLVTFFDKLLELLDQLLNVFPRYEDVVILCTDDSSERIRKNIEEVYVDFLEIFQAAVRVFTRSSGKLKQTPLVVGSLLWRPFDVRFKELLEKMEVHRHNINEEIKVWKLKCEDRQSSATVKWREYVQKEHQDAKEERRLMTEERSLMKEEREQNERSRMKICTLLSELQDARSKLEGQRLNETITRVQTWLKPSDYLDAREINSRMRDDSTALWIFDHPKYRSWIDRTPYPCIDSNKRKFGTNMLWIHGHPGSGKTVLATSILDELDEIETLPTDETHIVLYYFFRFNSETSRSPAAAFRSLLSQVLWSYRFDKDIVDKFVFMLTSRSHGQLDASEETLVDLLQICLGHDAIIVIDGVDECSDSDSFISSVLRLSQVCNPRILLLSRINVSRLQRFVRIESQLAIPKQELSRDIRRYCERELEDLVAEEILPDSAQNDLEQLTEHLVNGADGMFLWARLMMEFLRSPCLSQQRRMRVITEINFPEGLEKMYYRIFLLISQSRQSTRNLAIQIFTWLLYCAVPMASRQSRQALTIDGLWTSMDETEDIKEFESAAIMACSGLVELVPMSKGSPTIRKLQLIHVTVKEILIHSNAASVFEGVSFAQDFLKLPTREIANFNFACCCLQQLLYHTPAYPLSGKFHQRISSLELATNFPFTDYAALCWIDHISATITEHSKVTMCDGHVDKSFEMVFHDFTEKLRKFLSTPKVVTVWLEAYYTSPHSAPPSGSGIRKWASWLSELVQETNLRVDGALLGSIFEFCRDLDHIVKVWDANLRLTPHIVWDEVTASGLAPSQLFFSSGSTRVKSRAPERPDIVGVADLPEASISAISADGSLLGVLSVWVIKSSTKRGIKIFSPKSDESYVSYELWPLNLDLSRIARVVVQLDNQAITDFLRSNRRSLSISPDNMSFSVSHRIWRLYPQQKSIARGLAREPWPEPIRFQTVTVHDHSSNCRGRNVGASRVAFSGQYVILTMLYESRNRPSVNGITETGLLATASAFELLPGLNTVPLLTQTIPYAIARGSFRVLFHPTLHQCVFWTNEDDLAKPITFQCPLYLWNFKYGSPDRLREIQNSYLILEAVEFSKCGSYLVSKGKGTNLVTVTQIPSDLLTSEQKRQKEKNTVVNHNYPEKSNSMRMSLAEPKLHTAGNERRVSLHQLGAGRIVKNFSISLGSKDAAALSSGISAEGLQLTVSKMDGSSTDVVQLVMLPHWRGSTNTTVEVKLPESAESSATIILHKTDARGYGDSQLPLVIERDPRFFSKSQRFLEPSRSSPNDPSDDAQDETLES